MYQFLKKKRSSQTARQPAQKWVSCLWLFHSYFRLPGTDFMILPVFWLLTGVVAGRNTRMSFTTFQY
jgi:hypothetical protein